MTYSSVKNKYLVVFKNYNGAELQRGLVEYGTTPEYKGVTPTRTATSQYTYNFIGWDQELSPVTGEITYTAVFEETTNNYLVTFKN